MVAESATPLAKKLGIVPGSVVTLVGAPDTLMIDLPPGVTVRRRAVGATDVVVTFHTRVATLARRLDAPAELVRPLASREPVIDVRPDRPVRVGAAP